MWEGGSPASNKHSTTLVDGHGQGNPTQTIVGCSQSDEVTKHFEVSARDPYQSQWVSSTSSTLAGGAMCYWAARDTLQV